MRYPFFLLFFVCRCFQSLSQTVELRTDSTIIVSKLRIKNHNEATGRVLTSDALGNASWQQPSGLWQQNGAYIRNTNPNGFWSPFDDALPINADDISNPPASPTSGNGTRMAWIPSRSAFQGGTFNMADG